MKAPWRRLLDIWTQSFLGRQDIAGNLGRAGDVPQCTPRANGELAWTPTPTSALIGGAIGLAFVFQPTPAPTPDSGNVYHTEATLWAAVNATALVTQGPLTIAVDSSLAPAAFAAPHDALHRVGLESSLSNGLGGANTLTINDGATLSNLRSIQHLVVNCVCATAAALAFSAGSSYLQVRDNANVTNQGAFELVTIPAGVVLFAFTDQGSAFVQGGAGPIFNFTGAGVLATSFYQAPSASGALQGANVVTGAVGNWFYTRDASNPRATFTFTGTLHEVLVDQAADVSFSQALQPAPAVPLVLMTLQQATDMHESPVNGIGANYTVDTLGLDETIVLGADGLTISIPAGFPVGRELTIIDATPGVAGFTIHPAPTEQIGALAVGTNRQVLNAEALAVTIKKTGAITWRFKSSTLSS